MRLLYTLNGKIPILCKDVYEWAQWWETHDRHVAKTDMPGDVRVSTIFLGIDYDFGHSYEPVLFETMVFGGEFDLYMRRYKTWAEAEAGHAETITKITSVKQDNNANDTTSNNV